MPGSELQRENWKPEPREAKGVALPGRKNQRPRTKPSTRTITISERGRIGELGRVAKKIRVTLKLTS